MSLFDALPVSNDPHHVLAAFPAAACGLPLKILPIPAHAESVHDTHPTHRLLVAESGTGWRRYRQGVRQLELRTEPGMIELYRRGLVFDACEWRGTAGRCVMLEMSEPDIEAATHGAIRSVDFATRHEVEDEQISSIVLRLGLEALENFPNELLYSQGLCMALLGLLAARYAAELPNSRSRAVRERLDGRRAKQLVDLIRCALASNLSLERLASEVGLSPFHFARAFRETFGSTPHRYVQTARLEAARQAIRDARDLPLAEIAQQFGFASQSHMTELMRRRFGVTPGKLRSG